MERRGLMEKPDHPGAGRHRTRTLRSWLVMAAAIAVTAGLVAGCSSGSTSPTTTTSTTSTAQAPLTTAALRILQTDLVKVGCYSGQVDGVDGPLTTAAVKAFQSASGLSVDGVYGSQTRLKLLAAVNAGKKVCVVTTTTTTAASSVTTTTAATGVPTAALTAITAYEQAHGPGAGAWEITSIQRSTVDPSYVLFKVGPTPGHESTVQGGYGFAHLSGGTWSVTGFGTSEVGCPPNNSGNQAVPTAVLTGFGLNCPTA